MRQIRTNNDVEGWHLKLNQKAARGQIQLYLLLDLLHQEARYVEAQAKLVRDEQLTRVQRVEYRRINLAINSLWEKFNQGTISTMELLRGASKIYGRVASRTSFLRDRALIRLQTQIFLESALTKLYENA